MARKTSIILDTNWYVSATVNRTSRRKLYELLTNESVVILYSKELLEEYTQVIQRDKFRKWVSLNQAERFIRLVISKLEEISIKTQVRKSRDEDDNYLLSMSVDGKANYLITGDPDLLELREIGTTKIVKMSEYDKLKKNW